MNKCEELILMNKSYISLLEKKIKLQDASRNEGFHAGAIMALCVAVFFFYILYKTGGNSK